MKAPMYCTLYLMMVPVARECGYALAVHGSVARDLDLVAIPWTPEAVTREQLVAKLLQEFNFLVELDPGHPSRLKPHGRICHSLGWDAGCYVDLSVMPTEELMLRLCDHHVSLQRQVAQLQDQALLDAALIDELSQRLEAQCP